MDPAYAQLLAQSKIDTNNAAIAGAQQEGASLTARYGTLTAGDNAALLARYGANLAMAQSGGGGANPLLPKVA